MSADNFVAVFPSYDLLGRTDKWYAVHGMMSSIEDHESEKKWRKNKILNGQNIFPNRESAILFAHDYAKEIGTEYGVIELI